MLESLSLSSSNAGRLDSSNSFYQASGPGDWIVNFENTSPTDYAAPVLPKSLGGQTLAVSASTTASPLLVIALILGAAWLVLKK